MSLDAEPGPHARASCSVVVPVHNGAAHTKRCLDALLEQPLGVEEIVVVDDGSSDLTRRLLASYGERVVCVRNPSPLGFGRACNAAVAHCTGEHLVFLNNDTLPRSGWLDALRAHAAQHPRAGAVGARLLYPDGRVQHAGVCIRHDGWPHHLYVGFPGDHPAVTHSRRMQVVTAACALVPRAVFEELEGFDPAYINGYEDVDLCLRMGERGHEVHYCADAVVVHLESVTRGTANPAVNDLRYDHRWRHRVRPDETAFYLEDGLLSYEYEHEDVVLHVDALLGIARVSPQEDSELALQLLERAGQVDALQRELTRLRGAAAHAERVAFAYGSDGNLLPTVLEDGRPAPAVPSLPLVDHLRRKVAPLVLDVVADEAPRVNILLPELDPLRAFGGYITKLQLAAALSRAGRRVRLVTVDTPARPTAELAALRAYDGLHDVFDSVEVTHRPDAGALRVSPHDTWIATTWWTAHIAHRAARDLRADAFVYLIQEHEPLTFPMGSFAALAEQSYTLAHHAIFSSALLRDWFCERRLGVFAAAMGPAGELAIENPIVDPGPVRPRDLARHGSPAALVYARPAATESRNLLELALLGLQAAVADGALDGWRLHAVGLPAGHDPIELGHGAVLAPFRAPERQRVPQPAARPRSRRCAHAHPSSEPRPDRDGGGRHVRRDDDVRPEDGGSSRRDLAQPAGGDSDDRGGARRCARGGGAHRRRRGPRRRGRRALEPRRRHDVRPRHDGGDRRAARPLGRGLGGVVSDRRACRPCASAHRSGRSRRSAR